MATATAQQQPGMVYLSLFAQDSVKRLSSSDFNLDTPEKITLKIPECTIVLFYGQNAESTSLARIWSLVAQQTAGPVLAATNIIADPKIAQAMTEIRGMGSHPYHWAAMKGYPFILTYRSGYPVAFYNGERSVQALTDWAMSLACQANYYERYDLSAGVRIDNTNEFKMPSPQQYPSNDNSNPVRTQSNQFTTATALRGSGEPTPSPAAAAGTPVTTTTPPVPATTGPQVVVPR